MKRALAAGALALCILIPGTQPPRAASKTLRIVVENIRFGQAPEGAQVGDVMEWYNKDFVDHTATARDGSFDVIIPPGKNGRTPLNKAGVIAFYCRYHPNMWGKITVGS